MKTRIYTDLDDKINIQRSIIWILMIVIVFLSILAIKLNKQANRAVILEIENETYMQALNEHTINHNIGYTIMDNMNEVINDSILKEFLKLHGAYYPDILVAQAKLESNNYQSSLAINQHNIYGMKKVYKRKTLQNGYIGEYGKYYDWKMCALDRILLDKYIFKEKPSVDEYMEFLKKYAEDPKYIEKLTNKQ